MEGGDVIPGYPCVASLTLLSHAVKYSILSKCSGNVCENKTNFQLRAVVSHLGCTLASFRELKKKIPSLGHTRDQLNQNSWGWASGRVYLNAPQVMSAAKMQDH